MDLVPNPIVTITAAPTKLNASQTSPDRPSDEDQMAHSSPINGHTSPHRHSPSDKLRQLIVPSSTGATLTLLTNGDASQVLTNGDSNQLITNGDVNQTIVTSAAEIRSDQHTQANSSVMHHEVHIKAEPLDPMPPLASPAQMVDVGADGVDRNRDLEPSPPTTVISLTPAQPYPPGTTQLTFAAPAYDIGGSGQYTVQVCHLALSHAKQLSPLRR